MQGASYEFLAVLLVFNSVLLLASFVLASSAAFAVLGRLIHTPMGRSIAWASSLTLGPAFLSWILTHLLYFTPGRSPAYYLTVAGAVVLLPGLVFVRGFLLAGWHGLGAHLASFKHLPLRALLTAAFVAAIVFSLGQLVVVHLFIPVNANDPLEYATVARIIAENTSAREYPYSEPAFTGGIQASWTHPLGYVSLLVYGYLLQGSTDYAGVIRMVAPWFAFSGAVLLYVIAGYKRPLAGAIAALLMLTTPYFFQLAVQAHIDVMRLAALTAAFAAIWLLAREQTWRAAVFAGLCAGACHFVHSIGLITLPLLLPLYFLISAARWHITWRNMAIVGGIAISAVMLRISVNFAEFGTLVKDGPIIWGFEHLRVQEHREVIRLLYTPYDKVVRGVFAGWSRVNLFGYTYWLGTVALLAAAWAFRGELRRPIHLLKARAWRLDDPILAALIMTGGYFALAILSLAAGTDLVIKNARYLLTVHPLVVLITARIVAWPLDRGEGVHFAMARRGAD